MLSCESIAISDEYVLLSCVFVVKKGFSQPLLLPPPTPHWKIQLSYHLMHCGYVARRSGKMQFSSSRKWTRRRRTEFTAASTYPLSTTTVFSTVPLFLEFFLFVFRGCLFEIIIIIACNGVSLCYDDLSYFSCLFHSFIYVTCLNRFYMSYL